MSNRVKLARKKEILADWSCKNWPSHSKKILAPKFHFAGPGKKKFWPTVPATVDFRAISENFWPESFTGDRIDVYSPDSPSSNLVEHL